MADERVSPNIVSTTTLMAVVALFGGVFFAAPALRSLRPAAPNPTLRETHEIAQVDARLWQDPFSALYDHIRRAESMPSANIQGRSPFTPLNDLAEELRHRAANSSKGEECVVLPVLVPGGPYAELAEHRRRFRYATLAALATAGIHPSHADRVGALTLQVEINRSAGKSSHRLEIPFEWTASKDSNRNVLVLWIDEARLGDNPLFGMAGIAMRLEAQVGDTYPPIAWRVIGPSTSDTLRMALRQPELWWCRIGDLAVQPSRPRPQVIEPRSAFEGLWMRVDRLKTDIIRTSRDHRWMSQDEVADFCKYRLEVFSPTATASPSILLDDVKPDRHFQLTADQAEVQRRWECLEADALGVKSFLAISSNDRILSEALLDELDTRGIRPAESAQDHILLIGESDTAYARSFTLAFRQAVESRVAEDVEDVEDRIHVIRYLRGLDGATAGGQSTGLTSPSRDSASPKVAVSQSQAGASTQYGKVKELEHAVGDSQLDYVRRIVSRVGEIKRSLSAHDRLRAVGIIATDFYDKQLILQALRRSMPSTVFFTTDLDARYLSPSEYKWNRNLIVAAPYGLRLHRSLQPETPPFRSSTQTAAFLAVSLAMKSEPAQKSLIGTWPYESRGNSPPTNVEILRTLVPRIFEIGRRGVVEMRPAKGLHPDRRYSEFGAIAALHPPITSLSDHGLWIVLLLVALLLYACVILRVSPRIRHWWSEQSRAIQIVIIAISLLVLAGTTVTVFVASIAPGGERFSLFDGVSTWPTTLFRGIIVIAGVVFFWYAQMQLDQENAFLKRWLPQLDDADTTVTAPTKAQTPSNNDAPKSASRLLLLAIQRALAQVGVIWEKYYPKNARLSIWSGERLRCIDDPENSAVPSRAEIIQRRIRIGRFRHLVHRSAFTCILFTIAGFLLIASTNFPLLPARGSVAIAAERAALALSVFGTTFVLLFALDIARVTAEFVKWLGLDAAKGLKASSVQDSEHSLELPLNSSQLTDDAMQEVTDQLLTGARHAAENILIVAETTERCGRLVLFPFVMLAGLIIARNGMFDGWTWPWALVLVLSIVGTTALFGVWSIHSSAEIARWRVLESAAAAAKPCFSRMSVLNRQARERQSDSTTM